MTSRAGPTESPVELTATAPAGFDAESAAGGDACFFIDFFLVVDADHVQFLIEVSPPMSNAARVSQVAMRRSRLQIHRPTLDQPSSAAWLINGYPATIIIWTAEEWAALTVQPSDAQKLPNGIWCALRID